MTIYEDQFMDQFIVTYYSWIIVDSDILATYAKKTQQ